MGLLDGGTFLPSRELSTDEDTGGKVDIAIEGLRLECTNESGRHGWELLGVLRRSPQVAIKYKQPSYLSASWERRKDDVERDIWPNSSAFHFSPFNCMTRGPHRASTNVLALLLLYGWCLFPAFLARGPLGFE
jgi:hypothetical protein